jgi:hypothetical protein
MSLFLVSMLVLSPVQPEKQGGIPIVVNPDTLVQEESGTGSLAGLTGELASIIGLEGGHFGVGIVDLESGESISRSEGGRFYIGLPNVITGSCGMDLSASGEFSLETVVGRDVMLWEKLSRAQQGSVEASQRPFFDIGIERIREWLDESGFDETEVYGVQLEWEGAPEVEANLTSVDDCLAMLEIVYANLEVPVARRIVMNPDLGPALESSLGSSSTVYGWISTGVGHRDITLIVFTPDGGRYGLVVLADNLCCPEKADLAFTRLLDAVSD